MVVVLDIGAGSKYFLKRLKKENKKLEILGFSGEPNWRISLFSSVVSKEKALELIKSNKKGIFKINSTYSEFNFEDDSLDMVCINSPHPLIPPRGIEKEIDRCLKVGGIVFYGHSSSEFLNLDLGRNYSELCFQSYNWFTSEKGDVIDLRDICDNYPRELPNKIFPSEVIESNLKEVYLRSRFSDYRNSQGNSYIYDRIQLSPSFKVWVKNK